MCPQIEEFCLAVFSDQFGCLQGQNGSVLVTPPIAILLWQWMQMQSVPQVCDTVLLKCVTLNMYAIKERE